MTQNDRVVQHTEICILANDSLMQNIIMLSIGRGERYMKSLVDNPTCPPLYCNEEETEGFGH